MADKSVINVSLKTNYKNKRILSFLGRYSIDTYKYRVLYK